MRVQAPIVSLGGLGRAVYPRQVSVWSCEPDDVSTGMTRKAQGLDITEANVFKALMPKVG